MSLQVWLPLNGDLRNQGLANIEVVNNGATIDNNGKIGKCYKFGATASDITLPASSMTNFTTEASISFWIKILSWNRAYATFFQAGPANTAWTDYRFGILRNHTGSNLCFTISNGTSASNANYTTSNLELNTWYHLSFCYKTGHCLIYINGILYHDYATTIVPDFSGITTIKIGRCTNNSSYQTNCLMNDVRIYDHALSDKEVEEISKGLVLHYKLDQGNPNLIIENFYQQTPWIEAIQSWQTYEGKYCMLVNPRTIFYKAINYNIFPGLIFEENTQYTISLDTRDDYRTDGKSTAMKIGFHYTDGTEVNYNLGSPKIWTHKVYTSGVNKTVEYIRSSYGHSGYTYIANLKVEKGIIATPLNLNNNLIYDSSGYNNNGTVIGSLAAVVDSARYNYATYFADGVNDHIVIDSINFPKDNITMNIWFKTSNTTPAGHLHWLFGRYLDYQMSIKDSNGHLYAGYYINNERKYKEIPINLIDGLWHMVTSTYDGSNIKIYVDGQLKNSVAATGQLSSVPDLYIGVQNNSRYGVKECNLSDARIYATALSDDQIKELYNTSATIDNLGNIHTREFDENSNLNITKTGLFQANEIKDGNYQIASILKDTNSIQGNHLYEY